MSRSSRYLAPLNTSASTVLRLPRRSRMRRLFMPSKLEASNMKGLQMKNGQHWKERSSVLMKGLLIAGGTVFSWFSARLRYSNTSSFSKKLS